MRSTRLKHLIRWGNRGILAMEGLAIGLFAGFIICCFRVSRDAAEPVLMAWLSGWKTHWWIAPIWLLALVAAARFLGWLVLRVPLVSGSGIPQTELVVGGKLYLSRREWLRVLPAKFVGCLVSTLGGLSLGREGPCIQMGAACASLISGLWEKIWFSGHIHIAAGAAAGMTAAFGSPLAGMLFVFEEMKTRFTWGGLLTVFCAVASAQWLTSHVFGFGLIFPFADFRPLPLAKVWLLPCMGICTGVAGVCYNKALLCVKNAEAMHTPLSQNWRILPPMLAAFVLALLCPIVLGGGEKLVGGLAEPTMILPALILVFGLKMAFSLFSYTGNVPGGILMPMLCIGALLGALCGRLLLVAGLVEADCWQGFIVYGMVGFFVSMVRVPLTGTALVMEMSGALTCLPGAALVAFIASWTATSMHCPPVYDSLRAAIVISKKKPQKHS